MTCFVCGRTVVGPEPCMTLALHCERWDDRTSTTSVDKEFLLMVTCPEHSPPIRATVEALRAGGIPAEMPF